MHEFRYHEQSNNLPIARTQRPKKADITDFFNYLIDDSGVPDDQEDFETTCKIKDEGDRMITRG